jgi:hypothetical protein
MRPSGSLPQRLDWNELRGFYRLVDQPAATPDALQAPHRLRTRRRMTRPDPVLIVHDTSMLDFTSHPALHPHIGPIGDGDGRGILQHNSVAFAPRTHELLGLAYQQMELRVPRPEHETRSRRRKREARESHLWADGVTGVGPAPEGCRWVDVADSGGDGFGLMRACLAMGHAFLIRLCRDRRVATDSDDEEIPGYLLQAVRRLAAAQTRELSIARRGGREARVACLSIAWQRVRIDPPVGESRFRDAGAIEVTAIRVWEATPPAGEPGLEWVLGYSGEVPDPEAAWEIRDWYEYRWPIAEEYHKVEKTGCGEERLRFETWPRMRAALAVLSVIAIRVLGLRWQLDHQPESDAQEVASRIEIEVVARLTRGPKPKRYTVGWFVRNVAKLGGWLGRKGDGPPGWQSLWRGHQRLADIILGVELLREPEESS